MKTPIFVVNAFAENDFEGNPAAICPLTQWLPDEVMQKIAAQNNLSETAFFVLEGAAPQLRWFTPEVEVDFCGHATLASAHVVLQWLEKGREQINFTTRRGLLSVRPSGQAYQMDFPKEPSEPCDIPAAFGAMMGAEPEKTLWGANFMAVYKNAELIAALAPDRAKLKAFCARHNVGLIATAPATAGSALDFVSRFFAPAHGIDEDPVTGSAHCQLAPYWAGRLGKDRLAARQISSRGGNVLCVVGDERVQLQGKCRDYLQGELNLEGML